MESAHIHHEIKSYDADISSQKVTKHQALKSMKTLDGWCSEQKASLLIDYIYTVKPKTVVEIGVFGGKSLVPMAYALKENGFGKIIGIDPWSNIESAVGQQGANKEWWIHLDHEKILRKLVAKIKEFELEDYIELVRTTSENADIIPNIDILHIDGNHSEIASLIDVTKWVPHVRKGGMIIFDDLHWASGSHGESNDLAVQWLDDHCTKFAEYRGDNVWGIWIKND